MYVGIATQVSHSLRGLRTRQIIFVPALGVTFTREISDDSPRARWGTKATGQDVASVRAVIKASTQYTDTSGIAQATTVTNMTADHVPFVTGLPVGFHVTDDEGDAIMRGDELPRNVALRFQRALDAQGVYLHGASAVPEGDVRAKSQASFAVAGYVGSERLYRAVGGDLATWQTMITAGNEAWLGARTPTVAEARGAGAHRSRYIAGDEPAAADAAEAMRELFGPSAPVTAAPAPVLATAGKAVKPGARIDYAPGRFYIARKVQGDAVFSDVDLVRTAAREGQNVFLFGPPGTGKTTLLVAAHNGAIVVPITGDTEVGDLVGSYVQTGPDTFEWIDGPLVRAMTEGKHIVLDEVGLADSRVLAAVYPIMDGRRELLVTANPLRGLVKAVDGFSISGTTNPDAPGVMLSEALLSRFHVHVEVGTDYALARALGVSDRVCQAAEAFAKQRANGEIAWAPELRDLLGFSQNERLYGTVFALRNLIASAPEVEREVVESALRERYGDLPKAKDRIKRLALGD